MTDAQPRFYRGSDVDRLLGGPDGLSADVVIVGGGQAGPAAAWALERVDPTLRIVLVEANSQLANGASTASLEAIRTTWVPRAIAEQTRRSLEIIVHADDYLGDGAVAGLNFRQRGYVWLGLDESETHGLRHVVDLLHSWGITAAQYLDGDTARREFPWLPAHTVGARVDTTGGWFSSDFLANRFARCTRHTRFLLDTPVTAIAAENGRVTGVITPRGHIAAGAVALAASASCRPLARTVGVELPVVCVPRQSFLTPWRHPDIPADGPLTIGRRPFPHFRPEGAGLLFAWSYARPTATDPRFPVEQFKDSRFPEATLYVMGKQWGHRAGEGFRDPRYLSRRIAHQIGYYTMREPVRDEQGRTVHSERALIDRAPGIDGLFVSTAHVGHGVMTAPAAAEILAALVVGQEPSIPCWQDFGMNARIVPHEEGTGL